LYLDGFGLFGSALCESKLFKCRAAFGYLERGFVVGLAVGFVVGFVFGFVVVIVSLHFGVGF
jgi:hypothetical protein